MNPHFWWYVSRSSGMVAAVLLVMTIVWGLLASTKVLRRPGLPAWIADLHRGLGALTVVFVVVHLTALVGDNTVHFRVDRAVRPVREHMATRTGRLGDRSVLGARGRPGIIAAAAAHRAPDVAAAPLSLLPVGGADGGARRRPPAAMRRARSSDSCS